MVSNFYKPKYQKTKTETRLKLNKPKMTLYKLNQTKTNMILIWYPIFYKPKYHRD